jgi:hypothetical protein
MHAAAICLKFIIDNQQKNRAFKTASIELQFDRDNVRKDLALDESHSANGKGCE